MFSDSVLKAARCGPVKVELSDIASEQDAFFMNLSWKATDWCQEELACHGVELFFDNGWLLGPLGD